MRSANAFFVTTCISRLGASSAVGEASVFG